MYIKKRVIIGAYKDSQGYLREFKGLSGDLGLGP